LACGGEFEAGTKKAAAFSRGGLLSGSSRARPHPFRMHNGAFDYISLPRYLP